MRYGGQRTQFSPSRYALGFPPDGLRSRRFLIYNHRFDDRRLDAAFDILIRFGPDNLKLPPEIFTSEIFDGGAFGCNDS